MNRVQLSESEIHETIDSFLDVCLVLSLTEIGDNWDDFSKLVWATFQRNLSRHKAIHTLIDTNHAYAESAIALTRAMVEDTISLEYMTLNEVGDEAKPNLDYLSDRFFDFQWVQLKDDLDFYKAVDIDAIGQTETAEKIEAEYTRVTEKYKDGKQFGLRGFKLKDENAHSWLIERMDVMLHKIKDERGDDSGRIDLLSRAYVDGSRSIHFNPGAILRLLDDKLHGDSPIVSCYFAFVVSAHCMNSLLRLYLDGIPPQESWPDESILLEKMEQVEDSLAYFFSNLASLHHLE